MSHALPPPIPTAAAVGTVNRFPATDLDQELPAVSIPSLNHMPFPRVYNISAQKNIIINVYFIFFQFVFVVFCVILYMNSMTG